MSPAFCCGWLSLSCVHNRRRGQERNNSLEQGRRQAAAEAAEFLANKQKLPFIRSTAPKRTHFLPPRVYESRQHRRENSQLPLRVIKPLQSIWAARRRADRLCADWILLPARAGAAGEGVGAGGGGRGPSGRLSTWPSSDGPHYGCRLAPLLRGLATQ